MAWPKNAGLWSAMTYGGRIRADAWSRAISTGEVIGTCRVCGEYMVPDDFEQDDGDAIRWFTARCLGCDHECSSPAGRVLRRTERGRDGYA